jgi:hypothetical protein
MQEINQFTQAKFYQRRFSLEEVPLLAQLTEAVLVLQASIKLDQKVSQQGLEFLIYVWLPRMDKELA